MDNAFLSAGIQKPDTVDVKATYETINSFLATILVGPLQKTPLKNAKYLETVAFDTVTATLINCCPKTPHTRTSNISPTTMDLKTATAGVHRWIPTTSNMAVTNYPNNSFSSQLYIAIYTAIMIYIDDRTHDASTIEQLERFALISCDPSASFTNPALEYLRRLLFEETSTIWGRYCTSVIVRSTLDFIMGTALELRYPGGLPVMPPNTCLLYSAYQRRMTGVGEAYSLFCFPGDLFPEDKFLGRYLQIMPEFADMVTGINDVLSFYKECVVGDDRDNLIMNMVRGRGITPIEALKELAGQVIARKNSVLDALDKEESLRKQIELFIDGYTSWHRYMKRYRLDELFASTL